LLPAKRLSILAKLTMLSLSLSLSLSLLFVGIQWRGRVPDSSDKEVKNFPSFLFDLIWVLAIFIMSFNPSSSL